MANLTGRTYTITLKSGQQVTIQSANLQVHYAPLVDSEGVVLVDDKGNEQVSNIPELITASAKDKGVSLIYVNPEEVAMITRDTSSE